MTSNYTIADNLVKGDLVMLTIGNPIEHPAQMVVFLDFKKTTVSITKDGQKTESTTNTLEYYPLTKEGLQVAQVKSGLPQTGLYRDKGFNATNIHNNNLLKINKDNLSGLNKSLYESIIALL